MIELEQMLELLDQKRVYFLHYEREMESMPLLPVDELEDCMQRGAVIIKQIEALDGKLGQLLAQNGAMAQSAVNNDCDRGQLSPEMGKLYDASMSVKAVASRILMNDGMIRERITYERDKALEGLKEVSKQSSSVAGKYQRTTQTGANTSFRAMIEKEI